MRTSKFDRLAQVTSHSKCVVNDQGYAVFMGYGGNRGDIGDTVLRVADSLEVDRPSFLVDSFLELLRIMANHPFDVDIELAQVHTKLVERASIQPAGADEVMARLAALC